MKLSDKIAALRQQRGLTQEDLASICNVSRQSISKWESDISLPEVDKLLLLSSLFQVSTDVLLKDDLSLGSVMEIHTCGSNAIRSEQASLYEGILIKESLADEALIDHLHVHKIELWNTGGNPKYWTVLHFTAADIHFPELASNAITTKDNWFVDFKAGNTKYVVFHHRILQYTIGDKAQKQAVYDQCRALGIPDEQMQWPE